MTCVLVSALNTNRSVLSGSQRETVKLICTLYSTLKPLKYNMQAMQQALVSAVNAAPSQLEFNPECFKAFIANHLLSY